jgi:hypothetical protein
MTLSTNALDQHDAPKLAAALERANQRIHVLEQENHALHQESSALRHEIRWIDRLLAVPASIMSPSAKFLKGDNKRSDGGGDGPWEVDPRSMAWRGG